MEALRGLATKGAVAYRDWEAAHARSAAALATAVNILARLPALRDSRRMVTSLGLTEADAAEVLAKQLLALHASMGTARGALPACARAARELERVAVEAGRAAGALALPAAAARRGPEPSPLEVAEALQDAWRMCRDELLAKRAALGLVTLAMPADDAAALLACYQDQPNIDTERLEAFWRQMAETAPRKPP